MYQTQKLSSAGFELDGESVAPMRESTDLLGDAAALRARLEEDGYLLLRGLLDRRQVLDARAEVAQRLHAGGFLRPSTPPHELVAEPTRPANFMPELLVKDNAPLSTVLHEGAMIRLFQDLLGEPVRYFDYTWFRSVWPGKGTPCHCDIVYMGRGERERLYTAWTPIGDVDFSLGGLMVLEGSHRNQRLRQTYGSRDVDTYCLNRDQVVPVGLAVTHDQDRSWGERSGGSLAGSPNQIRKSLGGRWLTTEYRAGDLLVFSMYLVHGSLDNHTDRIRLSSDSRYQPASAPADERWVGVQPIAHGPAGKRGRIC